MMIAQLCNDRFMSLQRLQVLHELTLVILVFLLL